MLHDKTTNETSADIAQITTITCKLLHAPANPYIYIYMYTQHVAQHVVSVRVSDRYAIMCVAQLGAVSATSQQLHSAIAQAEVQ